jgi:hypothetical protein
VLLAAGVGTSQALGAAISVQAVGILSGGAILLFAVIWARRGSVCAAVGVVSRGREARRSGMERTGIEPVTSGLQSRRSPS